MTGETRRTKIIELLSNSSCPLAGDKLAEQLGVSRQVIVQDIALLRAANYMIMSTNRGYLMYPQHTSSYSRIFTVSHTTDQIADELYTIIDCGGHVRNVIIEHNIYGSITASLNLSSRRDVDAFIDKLKSSNSAPLKELSNNIHSHTVDADNNETLDLIEQSLVQKGYFIS
ncbi:transcription repressor NadR [Velocimicrobium porci]|uniref:Transcription repressor NadR n=1 Tax=Velocimicrobium porci TaxID=2606634 RepID=A0A6L5XZ54_9FIRM|nr:transcription repressor NadR [Velocimicrobium porci]MSS63213.1 transcription repressor NadR [Velocimicrobium porci]